jgi:hypothetical protein
MSRTQVHSESGFAVAAVLAVLLVVGIVIGAVIQLAPVSARVAMREQQSVQALANAESGLAYGLAWLESAAFDPEEFEGPAEVVAVERVLDTGGYRNVTIAQRGNSEYIITATGYQTRPGGGELTRQVQTAARLRTFNTGSVFPRHWLNLPDGYEDDENHPTNDPDDPAYGYEVVLIKVPTMPDDWQVPGYGPDNCANFGKSSRDVANETCRWPGSYSQKSNTTIENAHLTVHGNVDVGGGLAARDSVIGITGSLSLKGNSRYENTSFYVGGNVTIDGDVSFSGQTTMYVNGDLNVKGSGKMHFGDGATFYVSGSVDIGGNGLTSGVSGEEAPWIVFFVRKGLKLHGNVGTGAPIPNVAFLLDTDPSYSSHSALKGNYSLNGGIYAPTRKIEIDGNAGTVWGSLIGKSLGIDPGREEEFRKQYDAYAERMRSFTLTELSSYHRLDRLAEWRELR